MRASHAIFLIPESQVLRKTPVPLHNGTNKAIPLTMELQKLLALHHMDYICVLHTYVTCRHLLAMLFVPFCSLYSRYFYGIRRRGEKK